MKHRAIVCVTDGERFRTLATDAKAWLDSPSFAEYAFARLLEYAASTGLDVHDATAYVLPGKVSV